MVKKKPTEEGSLNCALVCQVEVKSSVLGAGRSSRLEEVKQLRSSEKEGSSTATGNN